MFNKFINFYTMLLKNVLNLDKMFYNKIVKFTILNIVLPL